MEAKLFSSTGPIRATKMKLKQEDHTSSATIDKNGIPRFRKAPPAHYTFEIKSFSSLLETKVEKYETKDFEAGGYKWRMVIYPNGKIKEDGSTHISLFLAMTEPTDVSLGWEVNVIANFFVFDGIRDRYVMVQDDDMIDWRFHKMKMEWGFYEFLSHEALCDPWNGFLVNDRCIFGVEVFVINSSCKGESLSFVKEPESGIYTWKIDNFSALNEYKFSEVFTVEGRKWKLKLFPKGDLPASGKYLSLFLLLDDSENLESMQKLYANCLLKVKDQICSNYYETIVGKKQWFSSKSKGWGFSKFMLLSTLKDASKGYLVNDCMIIEVKFILASVIEDFN